MAHGQWEMLLPPASADGMHITATDSATLNLDVDVVVAKGLGLELVLVKLQPRVGPIDLESSELLGVRHGGGAGLGQRTKSAMKLV